MCLFDAITARKRSEMKTAATCSQPVSCDLHFGALPSSDRVETIPNKHIFSLREVIHYFFTMLNFLFLGYFERYSLPGSALNLIHPCLLHD